VRLDNTSRVDDRLVRKALRITPPAVFGREGLVEDLLDLYNTRYFGVIGFEMQELDSGADELVIQLPPRPPGPGSLQFGIGFLDDFDGGAEYHVQARHQLLPANTRGGEWENFIQFGTRASFLTSYYQPLDWAMNWYIEPAFRYDRGTQEIWFEGQAIAQYEFQFLDARVAAGRVLGKWGEIQAAAFTGSQRGSPRIGLPEFESVSEKRGGGELRFRIDTENSVVFPETGAFVDLRYAVSSKTLGSETDFEQVWGSATHAWTFGKNTIVPYVEYGDNLKPAESFFNGYFLGGLFRLSGLGTQELFGEKLVFGRILAYRRLLDFEMAGARVKIYAGFSLEAGNTYFADESVSWDSTVKGGSIFVGGETFIGPVVFAYGRTNGGRDRFYLAIGDRF
jgi:NTE family protein